MEEKTIAKECGARCRRFRMAQNMSQEELGKRLFMTAQAISKYEKEGISNIDTINKLSEVLGHDLLKDEQDEEGAVGEVGKEILLRLMKHCGFIDVDELIKKYLFGMTKARFAREIFKLEKLGLCVREQFLDLEKERRDGVFITAKGIITFKNCGMYKREETEFCDFYNGIHSYEAIVEEASSYQEYQELHPEEELILLLYRKYSLDGYRRSYIKYLYTYYIKRFEGNTADSLLKYKPTCYSDIVIGINTYDPQSEMYEDMDYMDMSVDAEQYFGTMKFNTIKYFEQSTFGNDVEEYELEEEIDMEKFERGESVGYFNDYIQKKDKCGFDYITRVCDFEIDEYIQRKFKKAETEKEKEIDHLIDSINALNENTLDYYTFPIEWEEKGFADRIRDMYGIKETNKDIISN